jgi:hypothetical protein
VTISLQIGDASFLLDDAFVTCGDLPVDFAQALLFVWHDS